MFPKYLLCCNWPRLSSLLHTDNQNLTKETPMNQPLLKNFHALTTLRAKHSSRTNAFGKALGMETGESSLRVFSMSTIHC